MCVLFVLMFGMPLERGAHSTDRLVPEAACQDINGLGELAP